MFSTGHLGILLVNAPSITESQIPQCSGARAKQYLGMLRVISWSKWELLPSRCQIIPVPVWKFNYLEPGIVVSWLVWGLHWAYYTIHSILGLTWVLLSSLLVTLSAYSLLHSSIGVVPKSELR